MSLKRQLYPDEGDAGVKRTCLFGAGGSAFGGDRSYLFNNNNNPAGPTEDLAMAMAMASAAAEAASPFSSISSASGATAVWPGDDWPANSGHVVAASHQHHLHGDIDEADLSTGTITMEPEMGMGMEVDMDDSAAPSPSSSYAFASATAGPSSVYGYSSSAAQSPVSTTSAAAWPQHLAPAQQITDAETLFAAAYGHTHPLSPSASVSALSSPRHPLSPLSMGQSTLAGPAPSRCNSASSLPRPLQPRPSVQLPFMAMSSGSRGLAGALTASVSTYGGYAGDTTETDAASGSRGASPGPLGAPSARKARPALTPLQPRGAEAWGAAGVGVQVTPASAPPVVFHHVIAVDGDDEMAPVAREWPAW